MGHWTATPPGVADAQLGSPTRGRGRGNVISTSRPARAGRSIYG